MKSKGCNLNNKNESHIKNNEATNNFTNSNSPMTLNKNKSNVFSSLINSLSKQKTFNIKFMQILFLCFFSSFLGITNCKAKKHFCGTDLLKTPKRILVPEEPLPLITSSKRIMNQPNLEQKWESLRIHFDFSYIEQKVTEGIIKQKDLSDLKEKIMPKAKEVFQGLLKVKRIKSKLKLNSPHCETIPIPNLYNHAGDGVAADIVIFVLIDTSGFFSENGIEAAAIHCLQHQETRRPIAGYIQFKSDLNINSQFTKDYYAWLAIHEISHILVINRALYEDYIDAETLVPLGYDRVIGSKVLESGSKMNFIKTPKVMEKAKEHFGCANLYGLPLEYNGGPGTAGSHWAKRYMNGDYMIGESFGENLISEISLALFEDSGWYKVNWEMANLFLWGKGKGCDFFDREKKCIYAEKVDLDMEKLNSTLVEFAFGLRQSKNNIDKDNTSQKLVVNKDNFVVKNNIFKNDVTNERLSLKVLKIKATEKVNGSLMKKKNKINLIASSNNGTNNNYYNRTYVNNSTESNNNTKDTNNKDSSINSVMKVFEDYFPKDISNNTKKFILQYKTDFKDEFCTEFNMPVCSSSHLFRGSCIVEDPLDPIERHEMLFKNTRISGYEKLTDRCPTAIESRYKQASYGGSCRYGEKFPNTKSFEKICPECACFMSNLMEIEKKNQLKKNFRLNNYYNENKNKISNNDNSLEKNNVGINNNNYTKVFDDVSEAENFLKGNKVNAQYEKIVKFKTKDVEKINFSFIEKSNFENFSVDNIIENKNKKSKKDLENEGEDYQEEYEIIKLNPALMPEDFVASCFEFKCEKSDLYLYLNENKFKCEEEGKVTKIPGYEGGIRCPDKRILCDEKYLCKFGCVEKFNNSIPWEKFDEEK